MAFSVEIEKRCLREIKKLDKKTLQRAFRIIEEDIAEDPYVGKALKGKYKGLYSYRFSEYRIVYEIHTRIISIVILRIAHRKDVYDGL
jgi:mRNA interferase RelE/StbE